MVKPKYRPQTADSPQGLSYKPPGQARTREFVNAEPGEYLAVLRRLQLRWSTNGSPYLLLSYQTLEPLGEWASQWVFGTVNGSTFHSKKLEALGFENGDLSLGDHPDISGKGYWLPFVFDYAVFAFIDVEPASYDPTRTQIATATAWNFERGDATEVLDWLHVLKNHNLRRS